VSGLLPALGGGAGNVIQLAAGGLSGILAMSALIASNVVAVNPNPAPAQAANLLVSGCMDDGPVLGVAKPGDQLWVTGRSVDGRFLRVHVPGPIGEGWVPAAHVTLLAGDPVPVAGCGRVASATGTPGPTPVPASVIPTATDAATPTARSTARPTAKPTPTPTQASAPTSAATPTPTPTPNVSPVFTINPPQVSPTSVGTNPLGTGNCGTNGTIASLRTAAADANGVAAIQLWIQKPGSSSFVRLSHGFSKDGDLWYASIDTGKDNITIAGTLAYRAVAIDAKGATTTSKTSSLTIFRCDTEASFQGGINTLIAPYNSGTGYYELPCGGPFSVPFRYSIKDADGLSGVSLKYTITPISNPSSFQLSGQIDLLRSRLSPDIWSGQTTTPLKGNYRGNNSISWRLTSADRYGGLTSSPDPRLRASFARIAWLYCGPA